MVLILVRPWKLGNCDIQTFHNLGFGTSIHKVFLLRHSVSFFQSHEICKSIWCKYFQLKLKCSLHLHLLQGHQTRFNLKERLPAQSFRRAKLSKFGPKKGRAQVSSFPLFSNYAEAVGASAQPPPAFYPFIFLSFYLSILGGGPAQPPP